MLPSHTKPTKIDISAHSRLLIQVSTLRARKELVMPATMPPWFFMLKDLKIFQSFTEWEILSEFTELLSDSITTKDNSTLISSITAHGLSSPLTKNLLFKRLEDKNQVMRTLHLLSQERITHLKKQKPQLSQMSENGLKTISLNTTSFLMICTFL